MYCPWCGEKNYDKNKACIACNRELMPEKGQDHPYTRKPEPDDKPPTDSQPSTVKDHIDNIRNSRAVLGSRLALISLIPMASYLTEGWVLIAPVGMVLGIAAFFCGISGLKHHRKHPDSAGKRHSWFAIITGGLTGWGTLIAIVIFFVDLFALLKKYNR